MFVIKIWFVLNFEVCVCVCMGSEGYVGMSICEEMVRDYGRRIVCVCCTK